MVAKAGRRKTGGTAVAREDVCTNALRRREALVQWILAAMMCLYGRNSPLSEMRLMMRFSSWKTLAHQSARASNAGSGPRSSARRSDRG